MTVLWKLFSTLLGKEKCVSLLWTVERNLFYIGIALLPIDTNLDIIHVLKDYIQSILNKNRAGMPNFNESIKEELLGVIV